MSAVETVEHSYMGFKGKTSASLHKYLDKYDIDQQIVSCALSLIQKSGYTCEISGSKKRIEPKSLNSIIIEVSPSSHGKGKVRILDVNNEFTSKWSTPKLSNDMLNYTTRDFLGYKIYFHPEHMKHGQKMYDGVAGNSPFKVQLLIIPGRGCITTPVS